MTIEIPGWEDPKTLRVVRFDNLMSEPNTRQYVLHLWDCNLEDWHGKWILGYAFYRCDSVGDCTDPPVFVGEDLSASPMHAVDSDETLRALVGFLTLRPGDTDPDYFDDYTPDQLAFAEDEAEGLQLWGMDEDLEFELPSFTDLI